MISNDRSTLRNFTRNFDAGGCKLIFDNQRGTEDNNDNKKAVMLDERETTYRSEDASNFLNFMTVMIIILYILYLVSSGLSVLSISLCTALVFCVIVYVSTLYTIALSTRAMLNLLGKCDVLGEAMQPFVHHQHDGTKRKQTKRVHNNGTRATRAATPF